MQIRDTIVSKQFEILIVWLPFLHDVAKQVRNQTNNVNDAKQYAKTT